VDGEVVVLALFSAVLVALAVIDARTRRLPNVIVLPSAAVVLAAQIALAPDRALEWLAAAFAAFLFLLVAHVAYPAGLGMGDVKLAFLLGAALGWAVAGALLIGLLTAALAGIAIMVHDGWGGRKRALPLGPFLALGGILAAVAVVL
jgi:leader peptidase (prepilin peptidase) / N-methyltransferase